MATSHETSSTPASATAQTCHLFRLPAELRNRIYELCLTKKAKEVNLRRAKPPSKALLLTSRQIYGEARLMQRRAYREYWSKTRFVIKSPTFTGCVAFGKNRPAADQIILSLKKVTKKNIAHINYLRVCSRYEANNRFRQAWIFASGMWTCWLPQLRGQVPLLVSKTHSQVWFFPRAYRPWQVVDGVFREPDDQERRPEQLMDGGFYLAALELRTPGNGSCVELIHESDRRAREAHRIVGPQVLSTEALAIALAK